MVKRVAPVLVAATVAATIAGAARGAAADNDRNREVNKPQLVRPPQEVRKGVSVTLPTMPSFQLPASEPGTHTPRELLVAGRKLLGGEVRVKGYITWIYDCPSAIGKPGDKLADVQRRIDDDPTLCERPKFYLGTDKDTAPERSLWVVDVPRPPNKLEKARLPKDELAKWPEVPRIAVGDLVVVTGRFAVRSPHDEINSDGLMIYRALERGTATRPPTGTPAPPPRRPAVAPPAIAKRAPRKTDHAHQTSSVARSNAATRAYAKKQYAVAIAEYQRAVAEWPDNHIAHYGLAGAHAANRDWAAARDAAANAIAILPDEAMYYLVNGIAHYEAAIHAARTEQARAEGRPQSAVIIDRSAIPQDAALTSLAHAVRLNPALWRAHYYLGRIYRDRGDARWAAEELAVALHAGPPDPGPWVALVELYREWGYTAAAIGVGQQGVAFSPDDADLWFTLGMAFADLRKDSEAIDMLTHAIALRADHMKAKFQRGQVYFRVREYDKAKQDLEEFVAGFGGDAFARQAATRMLVEIAAKKPATP